MAVAAKIRAINILIFAAIIIIAGKIKADITTIAKILVMAFALDSVMINLIYTIGNTAAYVKSKMILFQFCAIALPQFRLTKVINKAQLSKNSNL